MPARQPGTSNRYSESMPIPAWPWPSDSREDRARRVALSYRRLMELALDGQIDDPATAFDALDAKWQELGQHWVKPVEEPLNLDDWLSPTRLAVLFSLDARVFRDWARRGQIRVLDIDGQRRYNVGDVVAYSRKRHLRALV